METFVEVSPENFFKIIAYFELDVSPFFSTPQKSTWYFRNMEIFGKFEETYPDNKYWPPTKTYHVDNYWFNRMHEVPQDFDVVVSK